MAFQHGTYTSEQESSIKGLVTVSTPVVIVGTAPVNMASEPSINQAQLIQTTADAAKYFGGVNNIQGFTISESLYAAFQIFGVTPVVCINVLDPSKHKTEKQLTEGVPVKENTVTFEEIGIIPSTLKLKKDKTEEALTKFTTSFDADGKLTIEIEEEGVTSVTGTYSYLDPTKVTDNDIIGSVDPETMQVTGLECLKDIFPKYSMIPSYVITPGFDSNEVRAILDTKATKISEKYSAMSIIDMPKTTKYGEAVQYKKTNNWVDEDQMICFGMLKFSGNYFHHSVFAAMLSASIDAGNDGVPYQSPSNNNIKAEGIAYYDEENEKYVDIVLTEQEANLLNENGIVTTISRPNGIVLWGNRTSVYQPGGNTDPKDTFISGKRMFKYLANNIHINCAADVDKPMTFTKATSIATKINLFLNSLVAQEKLLGGRVEFLEEENPTQNLIDGKYKWHLYIGIVSPGESLHFVIENDTDYVAGFFA